jgi:hypothetical protein
MSENAPINASATVAAEAIAVPPRYWWLKRIAIGMAVLLVVLGGVRWWWGVYARRALQAEIDRYVAAGERVTFDDIAGPPIPDDQNAAVFLQQAATELVQAEQTTPALITRLNAICKAAGGRKKELAAILDATRKVRETAERAARCSAARWNPWQSPDFTYATGVLNTAHLSAWSHQDQGQFIKAIRDLQTELTLVSYIDIDREDIPLSYSLFNWQVSVRVGNTIETMLPELVNTRAIDEAACRQGVEQLIRTLLDDKSMQENAVLRTYRLRALYIDAYRNLEDNPPFFSHGWCGIWGREDNPSFFFNGRWSDGIWGRVVLPMVQLDAVRLLRQTNEVARAQGCRSEPEYLAAFPKASAPMGVLKAETRRRSEMQGYPGLKQKFGELWMAMAWRRMAAVALAASVYREDEGRWPETIEALVPRYLPSVPEDPCAADRHPLRYVNGNGETYVETVGVFKQRSSRLYMNGQAGASGSASAIAD